MTSFFQLQQSQPNKLPNIKILRTHTVTSPSRSIPSRGTGPFPLAPQNSSSPLARHAKRVKLLFPFKYAIVLRSSQVPCPDNPWLRHSGGDNKAMIPQIREDENFGLWRCELERLLEEGTNM
jgi:hypothetical protein